MEENKKETNNINEFENGEVNISDEVIEIISTIATQEVEGVEKLSGSITDGITEFFGRKNLKKGVAVELEEEEIVVNLNVIVKFGVKIPDVAWHIQESVKESIEAMTDLKVREVNIHVSGVSKPEND